MIDLTEMLVGCINFVIAWFFVIATGIIVFIPTIFPIILWIDGEYRAKWKHRVLYAYGYVRATFFARKR